MAYDYDKLYRETPDALGPPTKALLDAFATHLGGPARVLDIGCGQGRDALPLARMGHRVVGVDLSPKGVADMIAAAAAEGLDVTGHAADITGYIPEGRFDALLFDRTLHMLAPPERHAVLARLLEYLEPGGLVFLEDEPSNMAGFRAVLAQSGSAWKTLLDRRGSLQVRHVLEPGEGR